MPPNAPSARSRASATLKRRRASVMTIASSTHRIGTHDPAAMPPAELPPLTHIGASRYPVSLDQRVPGSSPGAPTNNINNLKPTAALDLPKTQCWEGHGKMQRHPTDKLGAQRKSKLGPPKVARACSGRFERRRLTT